MGAGMQVWRVREVVAVEMTSFPRHGRFLKTSGKQYGLVGETPSDLDDEGKESMLEMYKTDPMSSEGPIRSAPPPSLRAGRLEEGEKTAGSGGESIYGKKFNDEKDGMKLKHDRAGGQA
ncbi:hypothetical protein GUITHDRAFT_112230 [Guillardia theta CCMP2712]|uniref:Uncharacterized protein n=1 Tax=Guillardia theta (strain CCMP2712) TaxID=905079 RepID=L1IZX5_GUITC|nr:hypothetical protein GUITHDRAFT_112230 [Guillardia theta CCMP2712]EKX41813.1 hypothetical protein GUITHDRAFT_112230 [Guillardia theta CCMP2712]|eukprot:XP_005828793.1 hypothetical protein GUITHDRAFT_112230 [Guillardia theta CCMP2712]